MPVAPPGSAYCALSQDGCIVFAYRDKPLGVQSTLVVGPHPGYQYGIANFVQMFPQSGFVCRPHCPGCSQTPSVPGAGATQPPPPPPPPAPPAPPPAGAQEPPEETQPPSPPPETGPDQCAPAMSQRTDHAELGFSTAEHLAMTHGGAFQGGRVGTPPTGIDRSTWLATEPPLTLTPDYTRLPRIEVKGDPKTGLITVYHPPTGPGWTAFHSPDLNEFCLRGNGVHPDGKWPQRQSNQTLIIHSGASGVAGTDDADQRFGFGLTSARTINPRSGWYARRNSDNELSWTPTDQHGVDSTAKTEVFKVGGVFYTASGRRLNALRTSGDVTLTKVDDVVFITGAHTVALDASPVAGQRVHIVNLTAANRTVDRNTNNIDGAAANLTLPAGASVILVQDKNGGTDWRIAGAYKYPSASGSITFPIEAPDDGSGAYRFDGATVPGSVNAGMEFDQDVAEGPALLDTAGSVQLRVTTAGVEIPAKLTVGGFIDPTGIGFSLGAARPAGATTLGNGIWVDNDPARRLRYYNGATDYFLVQNAGATAADNEIPRFNATGIVIQGSSLLIDDAVVDATYGTLIRQRTFDNLFGQSIALALDVGAGTGSSGSVVVGAANADGVDLGRTGKTTTVKGSGRVDQMVHFTGAFAGAAGDDVAVGAVSCFRVTSGATLTGMVPAAGGTAVDGQLMVVVNATGGNITLSHDVTSAAANRLFMAGGANLTLASNNAALFRYSTADSRWRHVGEAGGGTGGGIDEGVSAGLNFWGAW